jgi:hypothetical protein
VEVVDSCEKLVFAFETNWNENSESHNQKCYLLFNMAVKLSVSFQGRNSNEGVHNTVLEITFECKECEITKKSRKLHNENLPRMFSSANTVRMIHSRNVLMGWTSSLQTKIKKIGDWYYHQHN